MRPDNNFACPKNKHPQLPEVVGGAGAEARKSPALGLSPAGLSLNSNQPWPKLKLD